MQFFTVTPAEGLLRTNEKVQGELKLEPIPETTDGTIPDAVVRTGQLTFETAIFKELSTVLQLEGNLKVRYYVNQFDHLDLKTFEPFKGNRDNFRR